MRVLIYGVYVKKRYRKYSFKEFFFRWGIGRNSPPSRGHNCGLRLPNQRELNFHSCSELRGAKRGERALLFTARVLFVPRSVKIWES